MAVRQASGFYTWRAPGRDAEVRLHYDAIDAIHGDAMRGVGVTRRRGTESGGILIGRFEEGAVTVLRHELVPCEYSFGPSYILSEADLARFRDALERLSPASGRPEYAVGYFRSHTRDGLQPDESDAALLKTFFPDERAITLLVKPYATRPPEAAIFLQRDGRLALGEASPEFLFERGTAAPPAVAAAPAVPPAPPAPVPVPAAVAAGPPPAPKPAETPGPPPLVRHEPRPETPLFAAYQPESASAWKARLAWFAFACAAFALGAVAGHRYAILSSPVELLRNAPRAAATESDYALDLAATHEGRNVMLRWNGSSAAIGQALRGVLTVTEGRSPKEVKLGFAELRNGLLLYHNAGPAITFKLEVFLKENRALSETVSLRLAL